jgi:hypothetical protein
MLPGIGFSLPPLRPCDIYTPDRARGKEVGEAALI